MWRAGLSSRAHRLRPVNPKDQQFAAPLDLSLETDREAHEVRNCPGRGAAHRNRPAKGNSGPPLRSRKPERVAGHLKCRDLRRLSGQVAGSPAAWRPPRICRRIFRRRCASARAALRREPARFCGAGVRSFAAADQQHVEITPLYDVASGDDASAVEACAKILRPVLTVAAEHYCSAARVGTRREARPRLDKAAPRRRRKSAAHRRTATDRDRTAVLPRGKGEQREAGANGEANNERSPPHVRRSPQISDEKGRLGFTVVLPRRKVVRRMYLGRVGPTVASDDNSVIKLQIVCRDLLREGRRRAAVLGAVFESRARGT